MLKVAVIGLGRFGSTVAVSLASKRVEVLAVDRRAALFEAVADDVAVAVGFDATDVNNLKAYDVGAMDVVVVAIGTNFEASVMVTMHCKALGAKKVVAKALNDMQASVLRQVGADQIVKPEEDMGARLAEHLVNDSVVDFVELPSGFSLRRITVPQEWDAQSLSDLNLLGEKHLNLVQIHRQVAPEKEADEPTIAKIPLPNGAEILRAGDSIDVIGPDSELEKFD